MNDDPTTMERLRADLIRRARIERHGEIDIQQMPSFPSTSRRPFLRLFRRGHPPPSAREMYGIDIESPKSPEVDDESSAPSRPFQFPNFTRPWTARSQDSRVTPEALPEMRQFNQPFTAPSSTTTAPPRTHHRTLRDRFTNAHSDESQVSGDIQHERRLSGDTRTDRHRCAKHPKRFMLCFPWIKSSRVRKQIIACFISGLILILLVAVYLGLSMTKKVRTSEMTIMLVLVILFATLFFFHGLIRLCITLVRGSRQAANRSYLPNYGPRGYAVPPQPIPVVLARDEEAAGVESEAGKSNPPAYGLWRESVRVDPNRLFWQRNESVAEVQPRRLSRVGPRPPSYASDDGVSYVMEATPRSTVPTSNVPLLTHPSEAGRVTQFPRETWR
ncbi:hypothetical protein B0T10DRAFT_187522 [Thelonectria olida]|uniref:Uncharacterized protein n=1 Tax=Thelonectria olida TaxID=1576542 RepID=A0A9P8WD58_9HYPO|nr:hypothetical protein B0T10DRAFT_187522 [Thelonectria olida]